MLEKQTGQLPDLGKACGEGSAAALEEEPQLEYSPTGPVPSAPSSTAAPPVLAPLYTIPKAPTHIMVPWESAEDLVLVGVVHRETLPPEEALQPPSQVCVCVCLI